MGQPLFLYDNRFNDGTPVSSVSVSGYPVANAFDWRAHTKYRGTTTSFSCAVDCGSAKAADYLMILHHNLGEQGSAGPVTIEVQGDDNAGFASPTTVHSFDYAEDYDNPAILQTFTSDSHRFWRVVFTWVSPGAQTPAIGVLALGEKLSMPSDVFLRETINPLGGKLLGQQNQNQKGYPLGAVIDGEHWSETITLEAVTWAWLRSTFLPAYEAHLKTTPFGFAWDPENHEGETRLVQLTARPGMPHKTGQVADLSLQLQGAALPGDRY